MKAATVATAKTKIIDDELKKRSRRVLRGLAKTYPDVECALVHNSPFELLVATILSAQCTDERVNMLTPDLFAKYPTPEKLAKSTQAGVEKLIHSTGFFRNKATNLRGMAKALVEHHGGERGSSAAIGEFDSQHAAISGRATRDDGRLDGDRRVAASVRTDVCGRSEQNIQPSNREAIASLHPDCGGGGPPIRDKGRAALARTFY